MVCRVKIRLIRNNYSIDTIALVNSGFETNDPDIVIPINIAKRIGLWPPKDSNTTLLDTGGGEISNPYYINCADLLLMLEDREPIKIRVNIIVNPHVDEVVISDYVASKLGIILLDFKKGDWRLRDDPQNLVRKSA